MAAGLLLGGALIRALHAAIPHEHFGKGLEGPEAKRLKRIWLFVLAITLHNFPEGMAVGWATAGLLAGFAVMMVLDVAPG